MPTTTEKIMLYPDQQMVHDQALSFIISEPRIYPFCVIKGFAGTGKSTTTTQLIQSSLKSRPSWAIGVAAPTHKAIKHLRKSAIKGISYRTIHSFLKVKEMENHNTGQVEFKPDLYDKNPPPIASLDVLFLDETSMLNKSLWEFMVPYMKEGLKVVFIGDAGQIPPVGEIDSIPFLHGGEWGALVLELTEVRRQALDSPIIELATEVRRSLKKGNPPARAKLTDQLEGVQVIEPGSTQEASILSMFATQEFSHNIDLVKVIAWQNKTVDAFNRRIRQIIYPGINPLPGLMQEEKIIMDKPYQINAQRSIATNEELEVLEVNPANRVISWTDGNGYTGEISIKTWLASVLYMENQQECTATFHVVHEQDMARFKKMVADSRSFALKGGAMKGQHWREFFDLPKKFGWINYNYAITAHKAQGSTYDHALIIKSCMDDMVMYAERSKYISQRDLEIAIETRNRLYYTAITRPRKNLYIEL